MRQLLAPFAPRFSARLWRHALVLVAGTLPAPGTRTVCAALRAMGRHQTPHWTRCQRLRNRAAWSSLAVARVLRGILVTTFAAHGPLVFGLDEPSARRHPRAGTRAPRAARGSYRAAVRSSKDRCVKVRGLRGLCLLLLLPLPWAGRGGALPVLTILAPAERPDQAPARRHKQLSDWARQALRPLRRHPHAATRPGRAIVVVAARRTTWLCRHAWVAAACPAHRPRPDWARSRKFAREAPRKPRCPPRGYAAIVRLARAARRAQPGTIVTRLRREAALYAPAPPRALGQRGRPRVQGRRPPTLVARRADPTTTWTPSSIANWYGEGARTVAVAFATAVWYHGGRPPVPLRRGTRVRAARTGVGRCASSHATKDRRC